MASNGDAEAKATALLRSPVGAFVVATVAGLRRPGRRVGGLPFPPQSLEDDQHVAERDPVALYELVLECKVHLNPYFPDYGQRVAALAAEAPSLREDALRLVRSPAAKRWFADLDRAQQVWVAPPASRDIVEPTRFHPDLTPFGGGTPKPRAALWTTTSIGSMASGWVLYLHIGEDSRPPPYSLWRFEPLPSARVYEIHEPLEWHSLCLAYPGEVYKDRLMPDWQSVARDWDAVHLSVGGLLTAEGVAVGTANSAKTELAGWSSESTVWFRWCFSRVERLPDVLT